MKVPSGFSMLSVSEYNPWTKRTGRVETLPVDMTCRLFVPFRPRQSRHKPVRHDPRERMVIKHVAECLLWSIVATRYRPIGRRTTRLHHLGVQACISTPSFDADMSAIHSLRPVRRLASKYINVSNIISQSLARTRPTAHIR